MRESSGYQTAAMRKMYDTGIRGCILADVLGLRSNKIAVFCNNHLTEFSF